MPRNGLGLASLVVALAAAACGSTGEGASGAGAAASSASSASSSSVSASSSPASTSASSAESTGAAGNGAAPIALVYRGPAGCDGCSEAVGALLEGSKFHFKVVYVGPNDAALDAALLSTATLYAQPGGDGTVDEAFQYVSAYGQELEAFIKNGGRYLGFCMGGYFAGSDPGWQFLPGDTDEFITSQGADVTTDADTTVDVLWRGKKHTLYFQDGPYFIVDPTKPGAADATVLATYASNGEIAALVAPFGEGKVGVVGPHPEATPDWYAAYGLVDPEKGGGIALGDDLVETTMQP